MSFGRTAEEWAKEYQRADSDDARARILRDWARWNEAHGLPVLLGVTRRGTPVYPSGQR